MPESLGFSAWCISVCVFLSTAGEQEVTDPLWVLGMNTLSSPRTSCPTLLPALDSPGRVQVYHGSSRPLFPMLTHFSIAKKFNSALTCFFIPWEKDQS